MRKYVTRVRAGEFCRLEVELRDGRLSICGSAGRVTKPKIAKREALFADSPEQLKSMNERCGTRFRSSTRAAKYVLDTDGEYHGLEVIKEAANLVYISCGQITDEIRSFFPEVGPFMKWHLNDLHAECVHQEARGETYQTHPDATCPDCGYRLGSAWTKRDLPAEVISWFDSLPSE